MEDKSNTAIFKYAIPVIRIIIGMAFFLSGLFKIIDLKGFQEVINTLELLSGPLPMLISIILPVLELILGMMLVMGVYIRVAALHANVLVVIFSWVTFYVLGSRPDMLCGCFGGLIDMTFSRYHFIVLFVIFMLNFIVVIRPSDSWTLQKIFREKIPAAKKMLIVEILTYVLIAAGIILIGLTVYMNFRGQQGKAEEDSAEEIVLAEEEDKVNIEEVPADDGDQVGKAISEESTEAEIMDITVDEAYKAYYSNKGFVFVDVRSEPEYARGHIKGALHIPLSEMEERIGELPKNKPVVVYCNGSSCNRSGAAARILAEKGFQEIYDLTGKGIDEWIDKGYPSE